MGNLVCRREHSASSSSAAADSWLSAEDVHRLSISLSTRRGRNRRTCQLIAIPMAALVVTVVYSIVRFSNTLHNFGLESRHQPDFAEADHVIATIRQLRQLRHLCAIFLAAGNGSSSANYSTNDASDVRKGFSDARELLYSEQPKVDCAFKDAVEALSSSIYGVIQYGSFMDQTAYEHNGRLCDAQEYISEFLTFAENQTLTFDLRPEVIFMSFVQVIEALRLSLVDRFLQSDSSSGRIAVATRCYETWLEAEHLCSTLDSLTTIHAISGQLGPLQIALFQVSVSLLFDLSATLLNCSDHDTQIRTLFRRFDSSGELFYEYLVYSLPVANASRWWSEWAEGCTEEVEAQTDEMGQTLRGLVWGQDDAFRRSVSFDVVLWFIFIFVLSPLIYVNGRRTVLVIYFYHLSFENKESQLRKEKRKTEALLNEMLPRSLAHRLQRGDQPAAEHYDSATVYFSDVADFADMSLGRNPMDLVAMLNEIYDFMDHRIQRFDVYKVETISSVYMVSSGVPLRNGHRHVIEIARLSLDIMAASTDFAIPQMPDVKLTLRIGIHTGPVVAGVVGNKMPRYCLFGDTVNTASRMQTSGLPNRIHISERTFSLLRDIGGFIMEYRGCIQVKGKGEMNTYWLLRKEVNSQTEVFSRK